MADLGEKQMPASGTVLHRSRRQLETKKPADPADPVQPSSQGGDNRPAAAPEEIGGPSGLEPTRFGDWERKGRCIDF